MMIDIPLPIPRSVISSPIHTSSIVPPTNEITMVIVSSAPVPTNVIGWLNTPDREKSRSCPYPEKNAIGTVSQCVNWLIR